jgi:hypothetical protein
MMKLTATGRKLAGLLAACAAVAAVLAAVLFHRKPSVVEDASPICLRDITSETGIDFRHTDGSGGNRYIVETVASGMATFDYDGDGLIDVYFLSGRPLRGTRAADDPPRNRLYRNLDGFHFRDVTERSGLGDAGFGLGVCVGDFDNDGCPDVYVANYGPNALYRNNGDGTFAEVAQESDVVDDDRVGAGTSFLDFDADGCLDLYVANYVDFTYENHVAEITDGFPVYTGPRSYEPSRHSLYHNQGDGTFTDVSEPAGIAEHPGPGMGMVCADYDDDGYTDIFVLNDVFGNFCWLNTGEGRFEEVALQNCLKYNGDGVPMGSMGVDCADFNHDGRLDFFQTSYQGEPPTLFKNLGGGVFEDVTRLTGANENGLKNVKWGCGFVDLDNDGHKDIFYVNGHLQDNVELYDGATSYEGRPVLLRNTGQRRFVDVSQESGEGMQTRVVGRGTAFDDLDNDGRSDVVILSSRRPAVVLRNESPPKKHWLDIRLSGIKSNRDGVGARVRVTAGGRVYTDEVHSGRGYQSHFGSQLHFGLGDRSRVERIEVRWIGGGTDRWEDVDADQRILLIEGTQRPVCW